MLEFRYILLPHSLSFSLSLCHSNTTFLATMQEVICSYRSKLFLYGETLLNKGTGEKTWKERGIGEARILRHRERQSLRFLMRREKTMKIIANFRIDPRIQLEPNTGDDRSWVWSCQDFSEDVSEGKTFALRFCNSEAAREFKEKYADCQTEMQNLLVGEDELDVGGETGEAARVVSIRGVITAKRFAKRVVGKGANRTDVNTANICDSTHHTHTLTKNGELATVRRSTRNKKT